jgi:hypothetical protein
MVRSRRRVTEIAAAGELDLDEEIDDLASEPGLHVSEPPSCEAARGAAPATVLGDGYARRAAT